MRCATLAPRHAALVAGNDPSGLLLWGIGLAAEESLMKAALADLIPKDRRAYGFGAFSLAFGIFWFAGSAVMGLLYDRTFGPDNAKGLAKLKALAEK